MSDSDDSDAPASGKSSGGYGRPPVKHRFKKGASGNPRGRPRKKRGNEKRAAGTPSVAELVLAEAYRPIQIRENDQVIELPMIQAVLRSLGVAAVKGNHRAQLAITSMVQSIEQRTFEDKQALFQTIVEYKSSWQEVFDECDRTGKPRPDPLPHPDDLGVNAKTGEVIFNGPFDEREKAGWDQMFARKADAEKEIALLTSEMKSEPEHNAIYESEIADAQKLHDMIGRMFPDEKTRRTPDFNINHWREQQAKMQAFREQLRSRRPK